MVSTLHTVSKAYGLVAWLPLQALWPHTLQRYLVLSSAVKT
jgi:hypothetical protein